MITFKENASLMKKYFLWDENDGSFLNDYIPRLVVMEGYSFEELSSESFLQVDSELFVVSVNAFEVLSSYLQNDVIFYPCEVLIDNSVFNFYVGKIVTKRRIIDKEKSTFWIFEDGVSFLHNAIFFNEIKEDFYLARDIEFNFRYAASSKFINLIEKYNLNISFIPQVTS